ncbi:hypothetical protein EYF80_039755 [Liparis tanakae]|uniref:Uncharacterized protein n=1 Tax=Liparis tanakae TaxID=230148 RepID=A0A4Z2GBB6_9TELE|nr:hypothetical protein EYF80_039755 [Liparis tanakae]
MEGAHPLSSAVISPFRSRRPPEPRTGSAGFTGGQKKTGSHRRVGVRGRKGGRKGNEMEGGREGGRFKRDGRKREEKSGENFWRPVIPRQWNALEQIKNNSLTYGVTKQPET